MSFTSSTALENPPGVRCHLSSPMGGSPLKGVSENGESYYLPSLRCDVAKAKFLIEIRTIMHARRNLPKEKETEKGDVKISVIISIT